MGGEIFGVLVWAFVWYLFDRTKGNREEFTSLNLDLNNSQPDQEISDPSSSSTVWQEEEEEEVESSVSSFERFFESYYRSPVPDEEIVKFLRVFLATHCQNAPDGSIELVSYFFARIARDRPSVLELYKRELGNLSGRAADVLLGILRQSGSNDMLRFLESCVRDEAYAPIQASISKILESNGSEFQSVLLRPVRNALDLDLLWAEFLATGEKEPVFRIIEVFNRPDLLREKLQEWLNTERPGFRRWRAKRRLARLPGSFGLRLEPAGTRVATLEDLDCRLALDGVQTVPGRADKIRALLPVQFGAEDLNYIWVKGAAKWSVASNACKHPIVLAACEEAKTQTLGAQLTLLEIRAEVCLQRWHPLEAAKILKEYVHLNPNDSFIAGKQANAARGVVLFPGQE